MSLFAALDLETRCNVVGCPDYHTSKCREKHSLTPWRDEITVIGVYDETGFGKVFRGPDAAKRAFEFCKDKHYKLVGHNFKFDLLHLTVNYPKWAELYPNWVGDTNLLSATSINKIPPEWLDAYNAKRGPKDRRGGPNGLKTLAPFHLGVEPFWETEDHDSDDYVLRDCEYTLRLYLKLIRDGGDHIQFVEAKLLPWTKMVLEAELRGVLLDVDGLKQYQEQLAGRVTEMEQKLDLMWADGHTAYKKQLEREVHNKYDRQKQTSATAGRRASALSVIPDKISYSSPAQMAWLLRDFLGYDITSLEGKQSTGKEVLERLAAQGKKDVQLFLEWRKAQKLMTAFIPLCLESHTNNILRSTYNMTLKENDSGGESGTKTGRLSAESINAQQIPPSIKRFIRARPGYKFVGHDLSAIEMRLIALYTQDENYFEMMRSGISMHDRNVQVFLGIDTPVNEIKERHPVERSASKNVGFALCFGAGANRLRVAFAQKGLMLTEGQARAVHKRWKQTYKRTQEYSREVVEIFESGGSMLNIMGRPLSIQDPTTAYMKALNLVVQSSASDLLLEWASRTWQTAKDNGLEAHPVLFVHDYVGFEVKEECAELFNHLLTETLKEFNVETEAGLVEITSEGGISDAWKS